MYSNTTYFIQILRQLKRKKYEYDFRTHFGQVFSHQMNHISSHNTRIIQKKMDKATGIQGATELRDKKFQSLIFFT